MYEEWVCDQVKSVIYAMENEIAGTSNKSYQYSQKWKILGKPVMQQTKEIFPYLTSKIISMKESVTKDMIEDSSHKALKV